MAARPEDAKPDNVAERWRETLEDNEYLALAERKEAVMGLEPDGRGGTENRWR
jgi:hypothetical protein